MTVSLDRVASALADRYTVTRELGRGGMATVFLAEDLRHHRKVAIKVLKDDVSASVGATRFLREIEIAAQLQHPHILPLLDSGETNGLLYYVMPYVEGQSLRQRLARQGELPVGDAVRIVMDVADALAYAHSQGVVHRDIKPDNIMLTGRHAVVADFGVARAVSQATEGSATLTSLGVALGTPAYMAPEQAVADPHVDQRADIYALGVVAYELLAGRTPFTSASPQQMLAAQVTEKPDPPSKYRPGIAPALEQALMRCLEKRAADRFQSADELLAVLEPLATPSGGTAPTAARIPAALPATPVARNPFWVIGAAAVIVLAVIGVWVGTGSDSPALLQLGRSTAVTSKPDLEIFPDLSPDGKLVAYASGNFARMRIFIRPVGGGRTIPLSDDTTAIEREPRWSPDGSQIMFLVRGGVSIAQALGGNARAVIPPSETSPVRTAAWAPDGKRIAFVRGESLFVANSDASAQRFLATGTELHSCAWSAGTDLIACVSMNRNSQEPGNTFGNLAPSGIFIVSANGGSGTLTVPIASTNYCPVWSRDGRQLLFLSTRDNTRDIYALDIAPSGAPRGEPIRLTTGLGAMSFALGADNSQLTYAAYSAQSNIWFTSIRSDRPSSAIPLTQGNQVIESIRASRDGQWIIYDSNLGGIPHIWRIPANGGAPEQLTNGPKDEFAGDLSPDGRFVAYHSWRNGTRDIEVKALAGGEPERVTDTPLPGQESYPRWSSDGKSLLFFNQAPPPNAYIVTRSADGRWSPPDSLQPEVRLPVWSPDDKMIAYVDRGSQRVYVAPVAGGTPKEIYRTDAKYPRPNGVYWDSDGLLYLKAHDAAGHASFWLLSTTGAAPRQVFAVNDASRPSTRADFAVSQGRLYFPIDVRQSDIYVVDVARK